MNIKLLAIRSNGESNPYIKNLQANTYYYFCNDHYFTLKKDRANRDVIENIEKIASYPEQLYQLRLPNEKQLDVNVSAILGKNGSGKSTLLELLYLLVFCIGERKRLVTMRREAEREIKKGNQVDYFTERVGQIKSILSTAKIELIYFVNGRYLSIENTGKIISCHEFKNGEWEPINYDQHYFFYTICVNYSLYGLNSNGRYFWLDALFHKNDGYRTPIVLNPFRDKGVIDVNTELHLSQTRLLTNLIDDSFNSTEILDNKEIRAITFKISPHRINSLPGTTLSNMYFRTLKYTKIELFNVFESLVREFDSNFTGDLNSIKSAVVSEFKKERDDEKIKGYRFTNQKRVAKNALRILLAKYIVGKIAKICMQYDDYHSNTIQVPVTDESELTIRVIKHKRPLVNQLLADSSHVTLKLKQAMNAFIYEYFKDQSWKIIRNPDDIDYLQYVTQLPFEKFKNMVSLAAEQSKKEKVAAAEFIPTGFYAPQILVSTGKNGSDFSLLSSGEQQQVQSIHSILYHIRNLESLTKATVKYQVVNLVLDEIELYYHPEYQRRFVKSLLDNLSQLNLSLIKGVNIIFSTHSPFILSDIPHYNVVRLKDGKADAFSEQDKTFGSNIHEMLADSFFLETDLMGAFAQKEIKTCISRLEFLRLYKQLYPGAETDQRLSPGDVKEIWKQFGQMKNDEGNLPIDDAEQVIADELMSKQIKIFIDLIGEPIIRIKLQEMYDAVFGNTVREKELIVARVQKMLLENGLTLQDLE